MKDEKSVETTRLLEDALKEKKDTLTDLLSKNTDPSSEKPSGPVKQGDSSTRDQSAPHKSTVPLDDLEPLFDKMTDALIKRIDDKVTGALIKRLDEHVEEIINRKVSQKVDQLFDEKFKNFV